MVQIWEEQYKRDLESNRMIDLQEEIARNVAGRIGGLFGAIAQKLSRQSRAKAHEGLENHEVFFKFSQYQMDLSPQAHARAFEAVERVLTGNQASGVALSMLACLYANEHAFGRLETAKVIEKATLLAKKGVSLEPQNQLARALLAYIFFVSGPKGLFFREAEQSLELNPNSPDVVALLGWAMALYGEWERGLLLLKKGKGTEPD